MNPRLAVFQALLDRYGPQHWWPGESPFEVMVGAVLTQNTAWENVERAIARLKAAGALDPRVIVESEPQRLAEWIRPAGYFNVKARRLQAFCAWYLERGGLEALRRQPTEPLRADLLAVHGIGPETADDILLYALERPVFVIDAYTRRLFARLDLVGEGWGYERLRAWFEDGLPREVPLFNEYHALIVRHAKEHCRKRPRCPGCPLASRCPADQSVSRASSE